MQFDDPELVARVQRRAARIAAAVLAIEQLLERRLSPMENAALVRALMDGPFCESCVQCASPCAPASGLPPRTARAFKFLKQQFAVAAQPAEPLVDTLR